MTFFFFNDTATTEIYTLSLHDALPISSTCAGKRPRIESYLSRWAMVSVSTRSLMATNSRSAPAACAARNTFRPIRPKPLRSEEHTSELQSRQYLVCRLLLEKKKNNNVC